MSVTASSGRVRARAWLVILAVATGLASSQRPPHAIATKPHHLCRPSPHNTCPLPVAAAFAPRRCGGAQARVNGWQPVPGAWPELDGTRFRVWAPECDQIDVVWYANGLAVSRPLARLPDGRHTGWFRDVRAGTPYRLQNHDQVGNRALGDRLYHDMTTACSRPRDRGCAAFSTRLRRRFASARRSSSSNRAAAPCFATSCAIMAGGFGFEAEHVRPFGQGGRVRPPAGGQPCGAGRPEDTAIAAERIARLEPAHIATAAALIGTAALIAHRWRAITPSYGERTD